MLTRFPRHRSLAVVAFLGTASCGPGTSIAVGNYDRTCESDEQCVVVVNGNTCECGEHCGAINVSEQARYNEDLQKLDGCDVAAACGDDDPFLQCSALVNVCLNGQCAFVQP